MKGVTFFFIFKILKSGFCKKKKKIKAVLGELELEKKFSGFFHFLVFEKIKKKKKSK